MSESRKIAFQGREFTLPALTLDQLDELAETLQQANPLTPEGRQALRRVLSAALAGQITPEELGHLPMGLDELFEAQVQLMEVSGLVPLLKRLAERAASHSTGPS